MRTSCCSTTFLSSMSLIGDSRRPSGPSRPAPRALASAVLLVALASLRAEPAQANEIILQSDLFARANPAGVMLQIGGLSRWTLGPSPRPDWPAPRLDLGAVVGANPAYGQGSLFAEWMPLAFTVLRAQADLFGFFGANGALLEMPDGQASFGDHDIDALAGHERRRLGGRVMLQPTLRAKLGRLIIRNQTDVAWYQLGSGGPYFYEWEYDALVKSNDWIVANRTALLAELWSGSADAVLLVGPSYELRRALSAELQRQRLGGLAFFCPADRLGPLSRPRIFLQAGINLRDRNRQGELFVIGGLGTDFDIVPGKNTK